MVFMLFKAFKPYDYEKGTGSKRTSLLVYHGYNVKTGLGSSNL